jgi:hypothetical protein
MVYSHNHGQSQPQTNQLHEAIFLQSRGIWIEPETAFITGFAMGLCCFEAKARAI